MKQFSQQRAGCVEAVGDVGFHDARGDIECQHALLRTICFNVIDVFDGDAVDPANCTDQRVEACVFGQRHGQFVDGQIGAAFKDLDTDDIAAHLANGSSHSTESSGYVGEPETHYHCGHALENSESTFQAKHGFVARS